MAARPRSHDSYGVGIICALAVEKAAVEAMLDEEHPPLDRVFGDDNDYTFGKIGEHAVAIACLPAGVMGNNSAATVAKDMMRSFPIRVGLMVGIAGGVGHTVADVRLGDIVVSKPDGLHGGVVQWDFGKMETVNGEGRFRRTGMLNKPPRPLLNAITKIQTEHFKEGSGVPDHLSQLLIRKPRMAKNYRYQGAEHDQLFVATYAHPGGQSCWECDRQQLVKREPRDDDDPVIHYGNIASGNEVMKDALVRDLIAVTEGVMCFEMEAAGLMDSFPCVVIRGICDYSDSHKNKRWQPYAAATAAAYAKDFLSMINPKDVEALKPAMKSKKFYKYPDYLGSCFVRRQAIYSEMKEFFGKPLENAEPAVLVLLGMGGSGKTKLAIDFCKQGQAEGRYDAIFWVDATSPKTLAQSYGEIAKEIYGMEPSFQDESELIASVVRTIKSWKMPWLIVFDNYDLPSSFNDTDKAMWEYWPSTGYGSILFNSRHGDAALLGRCIRVGGMRLAEGVDLLLRRAGMEKDTSASSQAEIVVELLGFLPLAIDQAGAYIRMNELDLDEYPKIYKERKEKILDQVPSPVLWEYRKRYGEAGMEVARHVFTTWELSYSSLTGDAGEKQSKGHFLSLSAFLDRRSISEKLFSEYVNSGEKKPSWVSIFMISKSWDRGSYRSVLVELKKLSLIETFERKKDDSAFSFHPLVRDWAQLRMMSLCASYTREATELLTCSLPVPDQAKYPNFSLRDRQILLSHVDEVSEGCTKHLSESDLPGLGTSYEFGRRAATFYSMSARHADAEIIWRRVLAAVDGLQQVDCAEKVRFMIKLSFACERNSHHSEAKRFRVEAWDLSQQQLRDNDRAKWLAGSQMALSLVRAADFSEAESLLLKCFEKQKALCGLQDLDTLATAQNIGRLYRKIMRTKDAEVYLQLAREGYSSLQGPDSSQALHAQADLADLYHITGRLKEAEDLLTDCVSRAEELLGPTNRLVISSLVTLLSVYRMQKRYADAEAAFTMAGDRIRDSIGLEHPLYLQLAVTMAMVWKPQGELDKAVAILQDANSRATGMNRSDNWDTIKNIKIAMIIIQQQQKKYNAAEALVEEIMTEYRALGISSDLKDVLWRGYFLYGAQVADPTKAAKMEEFLGLAMAESQKRLGPANMAFLANLKMAATGYEFLGNERKSDETSAAILVLWSAAGGTRYSSCQVDNDLAYDASTVALPLDNT